MTEAGLLEPAGAALSSGIYCLMFTDIEGSTGILETLGDAYPPVLLRQQSIVRDRIDAAGGREIGTSGDSFFAILDSADRGLGAAVAIQRALDAEPWPGGIELRVRIGLHFGMVRVFGGECTGLDVHRAARISAAGHGGQIVLSRETCEAVSDAALAAANVELRDLGRHRLKDLRYPEALMDVVDPTRASAFRPIRSIETRRTNLSQPARPIVGRDAEIAEVRRLLSEHPGRLVSITGAGGTGKTSLAEAVAALSIGDYPDGVFEVDVSGVVDPALIFTAIAGAMEIRDFPSRPLEHDLALTIGRGRVLLLLDTFEHLLAAGPALARLLTSCPNLRLLVTSQAALGLPAERVLALDPLAVPERGAEADDSPAMAMFLAQVRLFDPDFAPTPETRGTLIEIVRRMQGIPLAIEITAAQLRLLSPAQLLDRLGARAQSLRGARRGVARHRTLRDAIAWSEQLLDGEARDVLYRLSIFSGGFTFDDAEELLEPALPEHVDLLGVIGDLVARSLLRRRTVDGVPRFAMYDMVQSYAREALVAAGNDAEMARRHLELFRRVAVEHGLRAHGRDQRPHVLSLIAEADNIRAALRAALGARDVASVATIVDAMFWFWIAQGYFTEGLRWLDQAATLAEAEGGEAAATILTAAAYTRALAGDYGGAYAHGRAGEALYRAVGNDHFAARAAIIHAVGAVAAGETDDPGPMLSAAIDRLGAEGDIFYRAIGLAVMGELQRLSGADQDAETTFQEALPLFEAADNQFWQGALNQNIGHLRLAAGDVGAALSRFRASLALGEAHDYFMVTACAVGGLAGVADRQGDPALCLRLLGAVAARLSSIGARAEPSDQAALDGYRAAAMASCGAEASARFEAEGGAMAWAEAKSLARAIDP